jgi:hypothetical protein
MPCELTPLFSDLAGTLPGLLDDAELVLQPNNLPLPPSVLSTDQLVVTPGYHDYHPGFRIDRVDFAATKQTYASLGLLILAVLIHPEPEAVELQLTHPLSKVKKIVIDFAHPQHRRGLRSVPVSFEYAPREPTKHLEADQSDPFETLPELLLVDASGFAGTSEEQRLARDVLYIQGRAQGIALLAELLLNLSRAEHDVDEIALESEQGCRGVGPHSCEVSLWLPGSVGWPAEFDTTHSADAASANSLPA